MAWNSRIHRGALAALLALSSAAAQETRPETIAATPLLKPVQEPVVATEPSAAPTEADDLARLEAAYEEEYESWRKEVTALSEQEGFEGPYPMEPGASYYRAFRGFADQGRISARLWCLQNFMHDPTPQELREQRWLGEALSLATAVCDDTERSAELSWSLYTGYEFGEDVIDGVLLYLQDITTVEAIRRRVMATRCSDMLMFGEDRVAEGRSLAEELCATWPESEEARDLRGLLRAKEMLVLGGVPADFQGEDVDGHPISLYDYRGKVVLIDFWGFW